MVQPPSFIDLQTTEVPAADQAEGDTTVEAASAGTGADRPASGVSQIRVFHADFGQNFHPNNAVLGLEEHLDAGGQIISDAMRQIDAKIDEISGPQLQRHAFCDEFLIINERDPFRLCGRRAHAAL
jgi:hypothetical protein